MCKIGDLTSTKTTSEKKITFTNLLFQNNVNLTNFKKKKSPCNFKGPDIEEIPEQLMHTEAMVICNITKTFKAWRKDPIHAVKGINLRIYPNEITAILGHNGAGKTTLFNMLTGMTAPSSGTANICG